MKHGNLNYAYLFRVNSNNQLIKNSAMLLFKTKGPPVRHQSNSSYRLLKQLGCKTTNNTQWQLMKKGFVLKYWIELLVSKNDAI